MIEMTKEDREMERREYERREDIRYEKEMWKDAFFAATYEEKVSNVNIDQALKVADRLLNEFRTRFS